MTIFKIPDKYFSLYKISLLSVIALLLGFTMNFSTILSYSLFLKKVGVEYMPYHYMAFISSSIIGLFLFYKNVSGLKWLNILTVLIGFIYLSIPFSLQWHEKLVVFILFIFTRLYFIYGVIFYYSFVNRVLTVREMKNYIGYISGLNFLGAILAGSLTKPLLSLYSIASCFVLTGFICFITVFPVIIMGRLKFKEEKEEEKKKKKNPGLKKILNMNFVRLMIAFVILSGLIRYFLDFEFSGAISLNFPDDKELASFYGIFNAFSMFLILTSQIFLTGKILKFISLATSFKIISIVFLSFSLVCIIYPFFWFIVIFQFTLLLFVRIMIEPCRNVLVGAVSIDIRDRVRFVTEGISYSFGVALTGLVIALFNILSPPSSLFFVIIFLLSLVYLIFTAGLDKAYVEALTGNLKVKPEKTLEKVFNNIYNSNPHSGLNIFSRLLALTEGEMKLEVLRNLSLLGTKEARDKLLKALNNETEAHILCAIIKYMSNLKRDGKVYKTLLSILENTEEPLIKVNIIEVFAHWKDKSSPGIIFPFIFSEDYRVKANAVLAVIKLSSETELIENSIKELVNMLKDSDENMRLGGVAVLGELGIECFIPVIALFLEDPSLKVRKRSVNATLKLASPSFIKSLNLMLEKEENKEIYPLIKKVMHNIKSGIIDKMENIITGLPFEEKQVVIDSLRKIDGVLPLKLSIKSFALHPQSLSVKLVDLIGRYAEDDRLLHIFNQCFLKNDFTLIPFINEFISNKNNKASPILKELSRAGAKDILASELTIIINNRKKEDINKDFIKDCFHITGIYALDIETALQAFENIYSGDSRRVDLATEIIETSIEDKDLRAAVLNLVKG